MSFTEVNLHALCHVLRSSRAERERERERERELRERSIRVAEALREKRERAADLRDESSRDGLPPGSCECAWAACWPRCRGLGVQWQRVHVCACACMCLCASVFADVLLFRLSIWHVRRHTREVCPAACALCLVQPTSIVPSSMQLCPHVLELASRLQFACTQHEHPHPHTPALWACALLPSDVLTYTLFLSGSLACQGHRCGTHFQLKALIERSAHTS